MINSDCLSLDNNVHYIELINSNLDHSAADTEGDDVIDQLFQSEIDIYNLGKLGKKVFLSAHIIKYLNVLLSVCSKAFNGSLFNSFIF